MNEKIIILKFGGSSLADKKGQENLVKIVKEKLDSGYKVVLVLSAIGRKPLPYATDTLLSLVKNRYITKKELATLSTTGEIISTIYFSNLLNLNKIKAISLSSYETGIFVDGDFLNSNIVYIDTSVIDKYLKDNYVVVVPGFQGIDINKGLVKTLGRGGSDTTATALGYFLKADYVEIYTDVEGIYTTDPKLYSRAFLLSEITYEELGEMSFQGAKVLHPKAIAYSVMSNIPLYIKSALKLSKGTKVISKYDRFRLVSGITYVSGLVYVKVEFLDKKSISYLRLKLYHELAKRNISIDLISLFQDFTFFVVRKLDILSVREILRKFNINSSIEEGFSKISVIGAGMRGMPGVMYSITDALYYSNIDIIHATDSHISISVLIKDSDIYKAVKALHNKFFSV